MSKSTYFDVLKNQETRKHKDDELFNLIKEIYEKNNKKYGYPRITIELNNMGIHINRKRVARIMKEHHLSAQPRERKYCSYKGDVGVMAPNLVHRQFDLGLPYKIFGTDVTQFRIGEEKLYLSPIIDFHTREIVSYDISVSPNMLQIKRMMYKLIDKYGDKINGTILHSDQGWQYQQKWYQDYLKEHGMVQSMSRKGNCLDNSPTENFFGRLKEEVFYGQEWRYENVQELKTAIIKWIKYYNEERIVLALKTSPIKYKRNLMIEMI